MVVNMIDETDKQKLDGIWDDHDRREAIEKSTAILGSNQLAIDNELTLINKILSMAEGKRPSNTSDIQDLMDNYKKNYAKKLSTISSKQVYRDSNLTFYSSEWGDKLKNTDAMDILNNRKKYLLDKKAHLTAQANKVEAELSALEQSPNEPPSTFLQKIIESLKKSISSIKKAFSRKKSKAANQESFAGDESVPAERVPASGSRGTPPDVPKGQFFSKASKSSAADDKELIQDFVVVKSDEEVQLGQSSETGKDDGFDEIDLDDDKPKDKLKPK
jgi:hypothetical protein